MAELSCDAVQALIPELALGVLDGRERAEVLAHVEHCPACQHELLLMGDVADRLVELTPGAEPPVGFETAVMAGLQADRRQAGRRVGDPAGAGGRLADPRGGVARPAGGRGAGRRQAERRRGERRQPPPGPVRPGVKDSGGGKGAGVWLRPAASVLVAAAVAASVGVGGWALGHSGGGASTPAASRTRPAAAGGATASGKAAVADLVQGRRSVGQVVLTSGSHPWLWMTVSTTLGNTQVTCELGEKNGDWMRLGSFPLSDGAGYWGAPLPHTASPITGARVLDMAGRTVGAASISLPS